MKPSLCLVFLFVLLGWAALSRADAQSLPNGMISSPKKGVGFANGDGSFNRLSPTVDQLGCSWYYDWRPVPDPNGRKITAEFVPMVWGADDCTADQLRLIEKSGCKTLLTFNEPDRKDQSDMSVSQALELWPRLMQTGLRLGSPAPGNPSPSQPDLWLPRFMRAAAQRGYRVDFICLHWYGDVTDPQAVEHLRHLLTATWEKYHKPVWLTEFSGSTGSWLKLHDAPLTMEKNAAFVRQVLPMLESLPFVERYAWFELKWTETPWAQVALVDPGTGRPTAIGDAYRTAK
jgi:hypothetical protein